MENLIFLGVPILKHIRVYVLHTNKRHRHITCLLISKLLELQNLLYLYIIIITYWVFFFIFNLFKNTESAFRMHIFI